MTFAELVVRRSDWLRPCAARAWDRALWSASSWIVRRFLDHAMGWTGFAAGEVATFVVAGDHFTMFQEPGVQQMAEHIAAAATSHWQGR